MSAAMKITVNQFGLVETAENLSTEEITANTTMLGSAAVEWAKILQQLPSFEETDLDKALVDHTYQRPLKPHWRIIAGEGFSPALLGVPTLGRRPDGSLWNLNGQQRIRAMQERGIHRWMCCIINTSGPRDEARIFSILNGGEKTVKQVTVREVFRASVVAENALALATVDAALAAGFGINTSSGGATWSSLTCIATLVNCTKSFSGGVVTESLKVMREAWEGRTLVLKESIVEAVIRIYHYHHDELFATKKLRDKTVARLVNVQANTLIGGNAPKRPRWHFPYDVMVEEINKRRRDKLPKSLEIGSCKFPALSLA